MAGSRSCLSAPGVLTPQPGWSGIPIHDGPGDKGSYGPGTARRGVARSWYPLMTALKPCKAIGAAALMVALPAVAVLAPGICWLWLGSGICMEPHSYGKTLQQLAWGRRTESALLGFSPVLLETRHASKLGFALFSFCLGQPQSHADPCVARRRAASPSCTFRFCATSELKPWFSPGPLAPAPLWLWQMKQHGAREGKHCYANTRFTDRETESSAG